MPHRGSVVARHLLFKGRCLCGLDSKPAVNQTYAVNQTKGLVDAGVDAVSGRVDAGVDAQSGRVDAGLDAESAFKETLRKSRKS